MGDTVRDELAKRFPVLVENAKTKRAAAVRLFCIECMGGSNMDAKACPERSCALWPHAWRRGAKP